MLCNINGCEQEGFFMWGCDRMKVRTEWVCDKCPFTDSSTKALRKRDDTYSTPLLSRTSLSMNITAMKRRSVWVRPSLLAHKLIHIVPLSQATGQNCSVQKQEAAVLGCGTLLWEWNLFKILEGCTTSRPSVCQGTMGMRAVPIKSNSQRCWGQICDPKLELSVEQRAR